jgi:tetratricopeptide (TPR) repeat protein
LGFLNEHILFFGVILLVLTLGWVVFSPTDKLFEKKKEVMISPTDFKRHLELADELRKENDLEGAKREYDLAISLKEAYLNSAAGSKQGKNVLGEESVLEKIKERIFEPEKIRGEIERWEKIVDERSDYRDGYLKLAVLYWRLGEEVKARENLDKALEIDPNYDLALELKGVIR